MRILLAEDERINQLYLTSFLKRIGHTVEVVSTGGDAVAAAGCDKFDVILMDIRMPGMDGIEATRRLRTAENGATAQRVPILAMTAHCTPDDRVQLDSAGVTMIIDKPIVEQQLNEILTNLGE